MHDKVYFSSHRDFKKAWRVMGGIDSKECDCVYTFGYEGKPYYFQGPSDTPAFRKSVIRTLTTRLGPDNFHWTLEGEDSTGILETRRGNPPNTDDSQRK